RGATRCRARSTSTGPSRDRWVRTPGASPPSSSPWPDPSGEGHGGGPLRRDGGVMRARRLVLILVGLGAGLLVLGAILLASLPYLRDLPRIQGLLRAEASRLLDRPVRFERVSLGYLPLPAVHFRGFVVANAPGFGTDPLLQVDDARVRVRLLPL